MRKRQWRYPHLCCAFLVVVVFTKISSAQEASHDKKGTVRIELVELTAPVYPPLARAARIMGDVEIKLSIRKDGSVASAEMISGHPMLTQAALESARKSKFLCSGCMEEANSYVLTYTFGLRNDGSCSLLPRKRSWNCLKLWNCGGGQYGQERREPVVGQSRDRVVVLADSMCLQTQYSTSSGDGKKLH